MFPRFLAVIFVHGCYWHSHGCYRSTVPKTRRKFWSKKFKENKERDERKIDQLLEDGWRVLIVWECSLRGKTTPPSSAVAETVETWLDSSETIGEITGVPIPSASLPDCEA